MRTNAGSGYYPDVMVVCGPAAHRLYEVNATLVVEVLSRSTEDVDGREKAQAYATGTSLRQYVAVDPDHRRIEIATPSGDTLAWTVLGPGDALDTGYGVIELDALYDELDHSATT